MRGVSVLIRGDTSDQCLPFSPRWARDCARRRSARSARLIDMQRAILVAALSLLAASGAASAMGQELTALKIRLTVDGEAVEATLLDNATARDFLSLLPLTLTLDDYAATEKISYLPRKLSTAGAPAGFDPAPGDIAYYAPWGNVAIFYNDTGYARGPLSSAASIRASTC